MPQPTTHPDLRPGKMARELDPQIDPWEQQPDETADAHEAFLAYKHSTDRKITEHGPSAKIWSATWSWIYRTYCWDLHVAKQEDVKLVRYRIDMNERHRNVGRAMIGKVVQWLTTVDASTLSASQAARMFEIATRIEREAAGAGLSEPAATTMPDADASPTVTLAQMLDAHGDEIEADLALELHKIIASVPSTNGDRANGSGPA